MTREELMQFDGREGRKAYVAVNGTVYDFTASELWQSGDHQGAHQAGRDLTDELQAAPHVRAVIERFPVVGQLQDEKTIPGQKKNTGIVIIVLVAVAVVIAVLAMLI